MILAKMSSSLGIPGEVGRNSMAVRYWTLVGVFTSSFILLLVTLNRSVNQFDEGLILFGSVRVSFGDIPYRDFYALYGPAQFYVLAALFKLVGPSILVERLWDLIIRSSTVLVIYLIVDRVWDRWIALFVAILSGIWLSDFMFYGYPVFPCLLFSLLSLYCLAPVYRGRHGVAPLLASGICVGITALFRHDVGIATAAGGAFTLGLFHMTRAPEVQRPRALLRSAAIYIGGVVLAVGPALALVIAAGAGHDMLVNLILIPARIYVPMCSLPFPSLVGVAREVIHLDPGSIHSLQELVVYLPILAAVLGAIVASTLGKEERFAGSVEARTLNSQRRWILIQLSVFSLLFFFKGFVRVSLIQMALSIVPSLMIVSVAIWQIPLRFPVARFFSRMGFACLLIISLPPIHHAYKRFAQNLVWATDGNPPSNSVSGLTRSVNGSCFPSPGLERIRCFPISEEDLEAALYIQEHTAENEEIFVGLNHHDRIFVNNVLFYFVTKRLSATKWHQFDPGVQTTREIQSEIIGELQMRRPRYVVLSSQWENVREPNKSALSSGVNLLDQFIHANYRGVANFGTTAILEYREQ
jgi:hypothetical protein